MQVPCWSVSPRWRLVPRALACQQPAPAHRAPAPVLGCSRVLLAGRRLRVGVSFLVRWHGAPGLAAAMPAAPSAVVARADGQPEPGAARESVGWRAAQDGRPGPRPHYGPADAPMHRRDDHEH
eukprot:362024-Chlamydomonas_euryale.AAC.5